MELSRGGIVLRDYRMSDVDDEVRWTNGDTTWLTDSTPWATAKPVDPDELRADMAGIIAGMPENAIRWRFELDVDGTHIGTLSSYFLTERLEHPDYTFIDERKNAPDNGMVRMLGIEICEKGYWGKGIGAGALALFMEYYRGLGENRFLLETWHDNIRMLGCARKLGFVEICRKDLTGKAPTEDIVLEKVF